MNERLKDAFAVIIILIAFAFVIIALIAVTASNGWAFFVPFALAMAGVFIAALVGWAFARIAR